jgi:hypothetical protein
MGKTLYEEALIDAKELKEAATRNAQDAIMKVVTPKIKQLIEQQLLEDEELPAVKKSDDDEKDILLDLIQDDNVEEVGMSLPDEDGKVTIEMDKLLTRDDEEDEKDVPPADLPTDQSLDADDELQLDHNAVNALGKLSLLKNKMNEVKINNMLAELRASLTGAKLEDVDSLLEKTEALYESIQDLLSEDNRKTVYENTLENFYQKLNQLKESNQENTMLNEEDLMVALSLPNDVDVDPEDVDVSVVTAPVAEEEAEEAAEEMEAEEEAEEEEAEEAEEMEAEEEAEEEDEELELDLAHWLREVSEEGETNEAKLGVSVSDDTAELEMEGMHDEDMDEMKDMDEMEDMDEMKDMDDDMDEAKCESVDLSTLSDDTVIEISEADLRNEIAKMKKLREERDVRLAEAEKQQSEEVALKEEKESQERKAVLEGLRKKLKETELFNAKLLYTNKLLQSDEMTSKQKLMVAERLDEAKSLREVKLIYNSLVDLLKNAKKTTNESTRRLKRVLGSSSRPTRTSSTTNLNESVEAQRWAKLAGLNQK